MTLCIVRVKRGKEMKNQLVKHSYFRDKMKKQIKSLTDNQLKIAYLTVSVFPEAEIISLLNSENILLERGAFKWRQVAQLLKIEMEIRGIVDNESFQEKYLKSKKEARK